MTMQRFHAPRGAARAWLVQRASGAVLALFVLVLLVQVARAPRPFGYDAWAGIFAAHSMKMFTFAATLALVQHVWGGVCGIWRDWVRWPALRLALHMFSAVWLLVCLGWMAQVLWRL